MRKQSISFIILCLITTIAFAQQIPERSYIIKFDGYKTKLSKTARLQLDNITGIMKKDTTFNCAVISNCMTENPKYSVVTWDRANAVINYIVKQGIKGDRFMYHDGPDYTLCDEITLSITTEKIELPTPAPHPNLRKERSPKSR